MHNVSEIYAQFLDRQNFIAADLDYSILERHVTALQKLAEISNSALSVFDFYKKELVFTSFNFGKTLGYSLQDIETGGELFLDTKTHPDDLIMLKQNEIYLYSLVFNLTIDENYKFISEYRILNAVNNYVRVIQQQQVLELDKHGNLWLGLCIYDISPNQNNMDESLKSEILNFRTGKIIHFIEPGKEITNALSKKEIEILKLVKDGFLSKEISEKLTISVHTVNTHRQRVLKKMGVNNSMEAVMLASKLGFI
jgi:DNA-binding CsgD family transcriptional regulator